MSTNLASEAAYESLVSDLKAKTEHAIAFIKEQDWSSKDFYAQWLAQTFFFVCHSTRLLAYAAAYCEYDTHNHLHVRFLQHAAQELGHEKIALKDLKKMGYDISAFRELPETRAFYQTCYYAIERESPVAILGYALFLEALCGYHGKEYTELPAQFHGEKTTTFLRLHWKEDEEHVPDGIKFFKTLTAEEIEVVRKLVNQTGDLYERFIATVASNKKARAQEGLEKVA